MVKKKEISKKLLAKLVSLEKCDIKRKKLVREINQLEPILEREIESFNHGWEWSMYFFNGEKIVNLQHLRFVIETALNESKRYI